MVVDHFSHFQRVPEAENNGLCVFNKMSHGLSLSAPVRKFGDVFFGVLAAAFAGAMHNWRVILFANDILSTSTH